MLKYLKKSFKKIEILLFKLLKFDSTDYDYRVPALKDQRLLHLALIEGYFKEQPGIVRVALIDTYLFFKKAIRFALRKFIKLVRS